MLLEMMRFAIVTAARPVSRWRAHAMPPVAPVAPPTTARRTLLRYAVLLAGILYLDRVCISISQANISRDLGLSKTEMGLAMIVSWRESFYLFGSIDPVTHIPSSDSSVPVAVRTPAAEGSRG
jgi:hypothetical protein